MNIYYKNEKASLLASCEYKSLENIYDSVLELCASFTEEKVTITGDYGLYRAAIDSLCLGYTNAYRYRLTTREGSCSGLIKDRITVFNFDKTLFIDSFELTLESLEEPIYLGHLFLGKKTVLPRFEVGPQDTLNIRSEGQRSFGGSSYGLRRRSLKTFSANFADISLPEKLEIEDYAKTVLNIEPHVIDPYHEARAEFPPMYATLNASDISFAKQKRDGFYFSTSLSWQEAN